MARDLGRTSSQVVLAWVRQQQRAVIVPILRARTFAQTRDDLGCLEIKLAPEQLARLDEASRIEPGFPGAFLQQVQRMIYAETFPRIDHHRSSRRGRRGSRGA